MTTSRWGHFVRKKGNPHSLSCGTRKPRHTYKKDPKNLNRRKKSSFGFEGVPVRNHGMLEKSDGWKGEGIAREKSPIGSIDVNKFNVR